MGLDSVFPDYAASAAQGFAGIVCAKPTIMIAMTPRTGSTHLCAALRAAGLAEEPTEILNPRGPARQVAAQCQVTSFRDYIASFAGGPDPVFMFKTGWHDAAPLAPHLRRMFPELRVVYLRRRNDAAQAVSSFKAELTRQYHRRPGEPPPPPLQDSQFDMAHVLAIHAQHQAERRGWAGWFAGQGVSPVRLTYEDFQDDVNRALLVLAEAFGLRLRTDLPPGVGLERLADGLSRSWTERVQRRLLNLT